jgi:solute carrier family 25 iron transporter 28/37
VWWLEQVRLSVTKMRHMLTVRKGPAHAVYFATYEAVKHVMGGNQAGVHHPLAAGM